MRRVRIKRIPKAKAGGAANGYTNTVPEQSGNWGGVDISQSKMPDSSTRRTLAPVPREEANIEAEKGEVAYGDINGDGFFETYVIGGKRHNNGGTPLALPEGTFIFSDFRDMLVKDPNILEMFGKTGKKKKSYTPAALAKSYDINKYREILQDPNSDKHDMDTAETMIKEYQFKLGALALAQEAQKNFEQGIPIVARPYMEKMGITDEDILPQEQMAGQQQEMPQEMSQEMPMARYGWNDRSDLEMFIPQYQDEGEVTSPNWYRPITNYDGDKGSMDNPINPKEDLDIYDYDNFRHNINYIGGRSIKDEIHRQNRVPDDFMRPSFIPKYLNVRPSTLRPVYKQEGGSYDQDLEMFIPRDESQVNRDAPPGMHWMYDQAEPYLMSDDEHYAYGGYIPKAQKGIPDGFYTYGPDSHKYEKREGQWSKEANGEYLPLTKGDVQKRIANLEKGSMRNSPDNYTVHANVTNQYGTVPHKIDTTGYSTGYGVTNYRLNDTDAGRNPYAANFLTGHFPSRSHKPRWFHHSEMKNILDSKRNENEGTEANPIQHTVPYQRGGALPEYQGGGGITLIRGDYDTEEKWQRARYDAFKKAEGSGEKVYVQTSEGRRELTRSGRTAQSYLDTYDQYDTEGWADQGGVGVAYNRMMESLESDAVREHYIKAVNEAIVNPESYVDRHGGPGTTWTQRGWAEATPEEIMEATRSHQNRNMRFIAHNINPRMFNNSGTKLDTKANIATKLGISVADAEAKIKEYKSKGWKSIKEVSEVVGVPLSDDSRIRALEQATYWGGVNISKKLAANEYSEDEAYALRHFIDNPMKSAWGEDDEDQGSISPIDSIYGDTTAGHLNPYGEYVYTQGDLEKGDPDDPDSLDPSKPKPGGPAPWWLQDEINMAGNLIDRSHVKKYLPWAQSIDLEEADPAFVDPTFTANSINAGLRTSQDALAQFTGSPQAASASAMALQGQGAEQVAGAINRYDTQNVGIANQFEGQNIGIRNQELMYNNAMRDKLFDENVIANQQYDNTKAAYRAQGRMLYNNALTNRWKTDALNQMYPDYAVDPSVGGRMYHDPNYKDPNPTRRTNNHDIWYRHYRTEGMTHSEATEAARRADASDNKNSGGRNMTPFEQQYAGQSYGAIPGGQKGGYVMGSNVFPFMFY